MRYVLGIVKTSYALPIAIAAAALLAGCNKHAPPAVSAETRHPLRLDSNAIPRAQFLELDLRPDSSRYSGRTRIPLEIRAAADSLRLHAEGVVIDSAWLEQNGKRHVLVPLVRPAGLAMLKSESAFVAGPAVLHLAFRNPYNTQGTSLYKVVAGGNPYLFTQFEAWDARKAFPCFDEPAFKIPWTISLRIPESYLALANSPLTARDTAGGFQTLAFAESKPMPSYLVAFAVGRFDTLSVPGMSVPGRIYTVKGQAGLAKEAASMAPRLLAKLEEYFGGPMPYPKLDFVAVPEFMAGAMENPGAITFRDALMLFSEAESTPSRRKWLAAVMAHEMAHLWFGDLVTMEWWNDLWLNESFASWMGDRTVDEVFPEFNLKVGSVSGRQWAFRLDAMPTARAIRTPILPTDNPSQSFDGLAYDKGQEILGMLESWLGEDRFRAGIRAYMGRWAWKNASASDLWSSLGEASGQSVEGLMSGYLDHPGVPLVRMQRKDGKAILRQQRFLLGGDSVTLAGVWNIPMNLACADGKSIQYLLKEADGHIGIPAGICHPNRGESGYYRWLLPADELDSLVVNAGARLSERERYALVGNLAALAEAGHTGTEELLQRLYPLARDTSPQVLSAIVESLDGVERDLIDSAAALDFAAYVTSLLRPAMDRLGWSARRGESVLAADLRTRLLFLLARSGRDGKAGRLADTLAERYLKDPRSVDPSLARNALCVYAGRGDLARFLRLRSAFEAASTPGARADLLTALSSFRDSAAVDSALAYALRGPLRAHEFMSIPSGARRPWRDLRSRTLAWVLENNEAILGRRSLEDAAYLPWFASQAGSAEWEKAKAFFLALDGRVPGMAKEVAKVQAEVDRLAALRARDGARLRIWLASRAMRVASR